jgi:APA family basic amino acid/polyamine antiporter
MSNRYLGYDQVCGLAGEAMRPQRDMPRAILITLVFVTCIYMIATLVLTGMQDWTEISPVSGFPTAFYANHANWAGELTAMGEILTLPLVVLVQVLVQPRLQYAMAEDGLLPRIFGELDENGNIWKGTVISGLITIFIATGVPFSHLNDIISCAVLIALSLTDSSLILLWHEAPDNESNFAHYLVLAFNGVAFLTSSVLVSYMEPSWGRALSTALFCILGGLVYAITSYCPRAAVFGGRRHHYHEEHLIREESFFRTPGVPFLPCLGIFINWYLVAQIDAKSIGLLLLILGLSSIYYFRCKGRRNNRENEASTDDGAIQEIEAPYHSTSANASSSIL